MIPHLRRLKTVAEENALKEQVYATPESQRDELLIKARAVLNAFKFYPKYGVELDRYNRLKEVVEEVELRR